MVVRNETQHIMCQEAFALDPVVKGLEALFATLIMVEKRILFVKGHLQCFYTLFTLPWDLFEYHQACYVCRVCGSRRICKDDRDAP